MPPGASLLQCGGPTEGKPKTLPLVCFSLTTTREDPTGPAGTELARALTARAPTIRTDPMVIDGGPPGLAIDATVEITPINVMWKSMDTMSNLAEACDGLLLPICQDYSPSSACVHRPTTLLHPVSSACSVFRTDAGRI